MNASINPNGRLLGSIGDGDFERIDISLLIRVRYIKHSDILRVGVLENHHPIVDLIERVILAVVENVIVAGRYTRVRLDLLSH